MLKMRLKKTGRKREPWYRLVIMENSTRRDGRPIEEIGFYSTITKKIEFNSERAAYWLSVGAKPTDHVKMLLAQANVITV